MQRRYAIALLAVVLGLAWGCSNKNPLSTDQSTDLSSGALEHRSSDNTAGWGDQHGRNETAEYRITLENLTPATAPGASQPFSPPVIATHTASYRIFGFRRYASDELRQVAEDAVNAPLVSQLESSHRVYETVEGSDVILPGAMATYTIHAKGTFNKLSLVAMLVNTNDGFAGANKVNLPRHGSRTYLLWAFDAGTERNTEATSDIPGPCCGSHLVRVPTHQRIRLHRGIRGTGDLDPAVYDWRGPVAKLTITRVD